MRRVCGTAPNENLAHFQWLAGKDLYRDLRRVLARLDGAVLDVGCGPKRYGSWLSGASEHYGIDVAAGPAVDLVIEPDEMWPIGDARFDAVICTQVLQYVRNPAKLVGEVTRVIKPGGWFVLSVPFAYTHHGTLSDYWRFSTEGVQNLLAGAFQIEEITGQGGIGSTIGLHFLNWLEMSLNRRTATRLVKALLFPVWILFCMVVNLFGWLLDVCDRRHEAYHNVLVVARRRS